MNDKISQIQAEIKKICDAPRLDMQSVRDLALCWGALQALSGNTANAQTTELRDIFPALTEYQHTRSISDFGKLCNEIEEFCNAVYISTDSEYKRSIYNRMISNLRK